LINDQVLVAPVNDDIDEAGEQERSCITIEGQNEKAAFQEGRSENDPLVKTTGTQKGDDPLRCSNFQMPGQQHLRRGKVLSKVVFHSRLPKFSHRWSSGLLLLQPATRLQSR
jgi:hypothetical protein